MFKISVSSAVGKMKPYLKTLLGDVSTLWIMATAAVCAGVTANQFRDTPLPLVYASKMERIQQAAERIATNPSEGVEEMGVRHTGAAASLQANNGWKPSPLTSQPSAVIPIDLATFRDIQNHVLILDTRPEIFHRLGHIPKAVSLPRDDFEAAYGKQRTHLEKHKASPVVIYCAGENCEDGEMVAAALIKLGFTQVHLFSGGWNEWTRAKLPEGKNL